MWLWLCACVAVCTLMADAVNVRAFQSNLQASGGSTADHTIKFRSTHTGALLNSIDTHSQVCALQWNRHEREIMSSHGFSQDQLCLWMYPSMTKDLFCTNTSLHLLDKRTRH